MNNTYLSVEGGLNGHLVIHSPIPVNKTIRYITLTVKNAQYDESNSGTHSCIKTVTIKQYPLEYITGIAGLYSYLDENTGAWPTGLYQLNYDSWAVDENTELRYTINKSLKDSAIVKGLNGHIGDNKEMKSKFYVEMVTVKAEFFV